MTSPRVSIVIPAYNENDQIVAVLERIIEAVKIPFECLIVVDDTTDETLKFVNKISKNNKSFKSVINNLGKGPGYAIRHGISQAKAPVIVVTMADGSDDPELIEKLVRLIERGVTVAAASRYMSGGQQVGAPFLKSLFSKYAGLTLFWFAGVGTHDATNSFKAYDAKFLKDVEIHSKHGFEIGLEITVKAKRLGKKIAELPTIWLERDSGISNFKIRKWLPHYLTWYIFAFGKSESISVLTKQSERILKFKKMLMRKEK